MEVLNQLEQLTLQIIEDIHETTAEQIEDFLEQRERMIGDICAQFDRLSDVTVYREQVSRILSHDSRIVGRMEELKNEASQGLDKFNRARVQRNAYSGGGGSFGESFFFDEKK
ncbi:hypothetical protein [Paenibacillus silvisoli]|uniref:hypothetical protein n=1 Tax=Paenibacillus silvisoli TaxID=3110539 RepID=UPI0028046473|nr:hypothetical protein [Paenibacillus silvisoli]